MNKHVLVAAFAAGVIVAAGVRAEDGVTSEHIILGQSCALSGPARALGTGMRAGLQAYFNKINSAGGINGRRIRLLTRDDGYEPIRAIDHTRHLIDKEKVFMLIGEVGTPTKSGRTPWASTPGGPGPKGTYATSPPSQPAS